MTVAGVVSEGTVDLIEDAVGLKCDLVVYGMVEWASSALVQDRGVVVNKARDGHVNDVRCSSGSGRCSNANGAEGSYEGHESQREDCEAHDVGVRGRRREGIEMRASRVHHHSWLLLYPSRHSVEGDYQLPSRHDTLPA